MYKVVLASNSPRRKEILAQVGIEFVVVPSDKEEVITKENPVDVVKELSRMKAADVAEKVADQAIIIGADTIVVKDGQILGKPKDTEDAKQTLTMLQNGAHSVYTGVTVLVKTRSEEGYDIKEIQFAEETKVNLYPMTEEQITEYIDTKEPMDKAGSYAIQGRFAVYIRGIEGDYYNVVGFPIARFYQELKKAGITINL